MTPAECRALVADIAELQQQYARRREAAEAAATAAPMTKARPPVRPAVRPAARRSAPPVAKPVLRRPAAPVKTPVPADWLSQIRADQQAAEATIFKQRLRAASAQVARGEVSAIDAARLDIINHRASAMGLWR